MPDDYSPLAKDVENKFQDWFGDPVSAEASSPAEADHSIEEPVPADLPPPAEEPAGVHPVKQKTQSRQHRSHHGTRRRHAVVSAKLIGMLFFGFIGAVSSAIGVDFFFSNLSSGGLYSDTWSGKPLVYIFAILFGFGFGLFIFYINAQDK